MFVNEAAQQAGATTETLLAKKADIGSCQVFQPTAVETLAVTGSSARHFLSIVKSFYLDCSL